MKQQPIKHVEIERAYHHIKNGGLAIIPSRVGYTLLGNSEQSIQKMFAIKGRPLTKPCVVLTRRDLLDELAFISDHHQPFIDAIEEQQLLCGFILPRKPHPHFHSLSTFTDRYSQKENGTSCFVINGGLYIQYLIDRASEDGTLVVGSSANQSGTGNEGLFARIPEAIRNAVEYAIEDDLYVHLEYDPSTRAQGVMVDLTATEGVIIRAGLQHDHIAALLDVHNQTHTKTKSEKQTVPRTSI